MVLFLGWYYFWGGGCDALKGVPWAVEKTETEKLHFSAHLQQLKGYSAFTDFIKN